MKNSSKRWLLHNIIYAIYSYSNIAVPCKLFHCLHDYLIYYDAQGNALFLFSKTNLISHNFKRRWKKKITIPRVHGDIYIQIDYLNRISFFFFYYYFRIFGKGKFVENLFPAFGIRVANFVKPDNRITKIWRCRTKKISRILQKFRKN